MITKKNAKIRFDLKGWIPWGPLIPIFLNDIIPKTVIFLKLIIVQSYNAENTCQNSKNKIVIGGFICFQKGAGSIRTCGWYRGYGQSDPGREKFRFRRTGTGTTKTRSLAKGSGRHSKADTSSGGRACAAYGVCGSHATGPVIEKSTCENQSTLRSPLTWLRGPCGFLRHFDRSVSRHD